MYNLYFSRVTPCSQQLMTCYPSFNILMTSHVPKRCKRSCYYVIFIRIRSGDRKLSAGCKWSLQRFQEEASALRTLPWQPSLPTTIVSTYEFWLFSFWLILILSSKVKESPNDYVFWLKDKAKQKWQSNKLIITNVIL